MEVVWLGPVGSDIELTAFPPRVCMLTAVNYLPIVSTSAGDFRPQTYIWKLLVGCIPPVSLLTLAIYYKHFEKCGILGLTTWHKILMWVMGGARCLEILVGLHGLTVISTGENFPIHEVLTYVFVISSIVYMVCNILLTYITRHQTRSKHYNYTCISPWSLTYKVRLCGSFILCHICSSTSYFLHTWYCQDGVYTIFSVAEYISVVVNVAFHFAFYWDFNKATVIVACCKAQPLVAQ